MGKRNHLTRVWLRQHDAGERRLAAAVAKFLDSQADHLANEIEQHANPTPELASSIVNIDAENAAFQKAIGVELLRLSCLGAHLELQAANMSKSFGLPAGLSFFDLPAKVLASIKSFLTTLEKQPYWRKIQLETTTRLSSVIQTGIEQGDSLREIVKAVRDGLGGDAAAERARRIARTETTGTLNQGHADARQSLIEDGLITGSEWLSLDGARESHAALDGVIVKAGELFNVGGHQAPYPGHYSLPGQERINCRCTTVAAATWADE